MDLIVRKTVLFLVFSGMQISSYSQMLRGTVIDSASNKPVPHATIFFNGTSAGTFSDNNGNFKIDISTYSHMPLTVSALGYYSQNITGIAAELRYLIYLTPKIYELDDVIIEDKGSMSRMIWRSHMSTFKKQFLGETMNGARCRILNESDIYLSANGDHLKAFAYKPLKIKNEALGYSITYFLDKFEYDPGKPYVLIVGNIIFSDDLPNSEKGKKSRIEKRRKSAYLGSRMQFFRSLWDNQLDSSGFTIKDDHNAILNYDSLVVASDPSSRIYAKYIINRGTLNIAFYSKWTTTTLTLYKDYVYFDKTGYHSPLDVSWFGEMSRQRIGDLLPYEYQP